MVKKLFVKKVIEAAQPDLEGKGLRKHLRAIDLTSIGIGAIIGAGIFVITGQAAAEYAGPAVVISFLIASIICTLAGVCFAELSSLIPASGGSYAYTYVALGELPAWLVGWAVSSLYLASASTVSVGFSAYFTSLLADFGLHIPALLSQTPLDYSAAHGWTWTGSYLNLPGSGKTEPHHGCHQTLRDRPVRAGRSFLHPEEQLGPLYS
jgi:APA family basic amino acid/polyamine antiporter